MSIPYDQKSRFRGFLLSVELIRLNQSCVETPLLEVLSISLLSEYAITKRTSHLELATIPI